MSLILDALRKIEQERKTRRPGSGDLRSDVLNYRGSAPPATRPRLFPLAGAALVMVAAAAAFLLWRVNTRQTPVTVPVAPATDRSRFEAQPMTAPLVTPQEPPQSPSRTPSQQQGTTPSLPRNTEVKAATAPLPAAVHRGNDLGGEGNDLVVSGIAWQEERGLRRAVVNGSLVGEGGEILGARVVEIKEKRVRFSRGGNTWEIPYAGGTGRE